MFPTTIRIRSFGPETGWIDQMRKHNAQYDIKTVVTTLTTRMIKSEISRIISQDSIPEPYKGYSNWFRKIVVLKISFQVKGRIRVRAE